MNPALNDFINCCFMVREFRFEWFHDCFRCVTLAWFHVVRPKLLSKIKRQCRDLGNIQAGSQELKSKNLAKKLQLIDPNFQHWCSEGYRNSMEEDYHICMLFWHLLAQNHFALLVDRSPKYCIRYQAFLNSININFRSWRMEDEAVQSKFPWKIFSLHCFQAQG